MPELEQSVSPLGSGGQTVVGVAARPVIGQTFAQGGDKSAVTAKDSPTIEQTVTQGGGSGRLLSESTRKMLENLDKHGNVHGARGSEAQQAPKPESPPVASGADVAGTSTQAPPSAASPEATAAVAAEAKPEPPADEHRVRADRLEGRNRELVAEVEKLKAQPTKREMDARLKALDEIERSYFDDPRMAVRRLQALALGLDDPKHADVDKEMRGLYHELTAEELQVPLDDAKASKRESERITALFRRQQREAAAEREAAQKQTAEPPEAKQFAEHTALVAGRLISKQTDGKAVADAYPLTMRLAEKLHGAKPEALILRELHRGFATGEYDPKEHDHKLIEQAAAKIETHYQALAEMFGQARPATSTATPTPADATAKQDVGQNQGARTITNASASVAPATPPAKQPDPQPQQRPKYKSEAERRMAIAKQHFKD